MISSSHWEKFPGGDEILSGWLLTLPHPHPSHSNISGFLWTTKRLWLIELWWMPDQTCKPESCWCLSVFFLHLQGMATSKCPQTPPLVCRECGGQRRFFAKLWKYKCSFFLLVIMIVLNYPAKKKFHSRIFQQDIAGSEFQNSVF